MPEPSFIVYGQVLSSGAQVKQAGMVVSVRYSNHSLAESTLTSANNYEYVLEVPLEASIGNRDTYKARVGDVLSLHIAGEVVGNIPVTDRGVSVLKNVNLPESFDSDGDGIFDSIEIADGRNPSDPNDPVKFGNLDLDGDGITNGLEFLSNTYDPNGDYDGDGFSNQHEYEVSTNPNDSNKMPKVAARAGVFSPVNPVGSGITFLLASDGSRYTWDEAINGKPTSIVFAYWNEDVLLDLMVATDQGKVFVATKTSNGRFTPPQLLNLFSLPVGQDVQIGFENFDKRHAPEMWAFSKTNNTLYLYQRSPSGKPYGSSLWQSLVLPEITGNISFGDINEDGAVDVVASGIDMSTAGFAPANTLALLLGNWDGYTISFNAPKLLTQQSYLDNSQIMVLPNIQEVGFDKSLDILVRNKNKSPHIITSFNGLNTAGPNSLISVRGVFSENYTEKSELSGFFGHHSQNYSDVYIYTNINENEEAGLADFVFYTGSLSGGMHQFRVLEGIKNTLDTDKDGIPDYKDINKNDPNKPLPNGNIDYDQDGIPYGIDGNHSGLEDADSDGMTDLFELKNGLNPNNANDASQDADGDGRTNFEESKDGTDPQSKNSVASQDARMITSVRAFNAGTSDMLLFNKELAVSSNNDPSVKIYNLDDLSQMRTLQSSDANGVAKMINAGNLLVMGNVSGQVEIWDATSGIRLAIFDKNKSSVTDLALDGSSLFALHADGYFYQYNIETLAYIGNWKIYDGFLTSLLARNNVLYIQASNPEKIMFVWDVSKQEIIYNINGSAECCEKVVAELSGETLILANSYSGSGIYATNIGNLNSQEVVPDIDISAARSIKSSIYVGRKSGVIERYSSVDGSFQGRVAAPYSQVREIDLINGGFISLHADGNVYFWEHK